MFSVPQLGSTIGRYRLDAQIGSGAMGVVFKAHDTLLNTIVCLKLLNPAAAMNPEIAARFQREALLARRITHPGVCRLFDLHDEGGTRFLTMEFIEGQMLRDIIVDKGALDIGATLVILEGLAGALAAAWAVGVIHRDLKPRNIMVRPDGTSCILDFGIATAGDVEDLTKPGVALGTMHYIAPEVWAGRSASHASDLYALGVIAYNCVTGRMPFRADDGGLLANMLQRKAPPPSKLRKEVPASLDELILQLITLEPTERPKDAKSVQVRLQEILAVWRSEDHPPPFADATRVDDAPFSAMQPTETDGATGPTEVSGAAIPMPGRGVSSTPARMPSPASPEHDLPPTVRLTPSAVGVDGPLRPASAPASSTIQHRLPLISDETMAPRVESLESATPRTGPSVSESFGASASHSLLIDGVAVRDHVVAASIDDDHDVSPDTIRGPVPADHARRRFPVALLLVLGGLTLFAVVTSLRTVDDETEKTGVDDVVATNATNMNDDVDDVGALVGGDNRRRDDALEIGRATKVIEDDDVVAPRGGPQKIELKTNEIDAGSSHGSDVEPGVDDGNRTVDIHSKQTPSRPRTTSSRKEPKSRVDQKAARARIDGAKASLAKAESKRGIRRGDLPKLDQFWAEIRRAEKRIDDDEVNRLTADGMRVVDGTRVDKAFVEIKLSRLNDRFDRATDEVAKEKVGPVMRDVLKFIKTGQFDDANRRLNDGFRILD